MRALILVASAMLALSACSNDPVQPDNTMTDNSVIDLDGVNEQAVDANPGRFNDDTTVETQSTTSQREVSTK